jgi:hypothetical protein
MDLLVYPRLCGVCLNGNQVPILPEVTNIDLQIFAITNANTFYMVVSFHLYIFLAGQVFTNTLSQILKDTRKGD